MAITLRDYQQTLYSGVQDQFRAGKKRVLVCSPTGSGKSYVFMKMAEQCKGKTLVLITRRELKDQHIREFQKNGIPMDRIIVETVQTVYRRMGQYAGIQLVIADEAHNFLARTFKAVIDHFDSHGSYTVGFSASPIRTNGEPLSDVFQSMVQSISVKQLIQEKRLSPYTYYAPLSVDVRNLRKQNGDYAISDIEEVMQPAIYGKVVEEYNRLCPGKQAVAFCVSIQHSQQVAQQFRDAGIKATHFDGNTPKQERKKIMDDFRDGKIQVLTNCALISEGVSIDGIEAVIMLRPSMSTSLVLQQWGRALRYAPGKTAIILDCVGNYTRHGLPDDDRHFSLDGPAKTHKEFNEDGTLSLRVCPMCFKTFKTAPRCPFCAEEYPISPRELEQIEAIRLREIRAEELRREEERKAQAKRDIRAARSYEDLLEIERKYGYGRGWARIKARCRHYKMP